MLAGCQSARQVAEIGGDIIDPTGIKSSILVGDHDVKVRVDMGEPDSTCESTSGKLRALVYRRHRAEGIAVVDVRTKEVVRVLTADLGWLTVDQLDVIEREWGRR